MPSQFKVDNKPFVSSFGGLEQAKDWDNIRSLTGGVYVVPNWTDVAPSVYQSTVDKYTNGIFSWDAWSDGPVHKTTKADAEWKNAVGPNKTYLMPVSPWFYTNLPEYNKNWMWTGDTLYIERLNSVLQFQPDMVEIITWNDYGESHYIGPLVNDAMPEGSKKYCNGMTHSSWLDVLPTYINAYKSGKSAISGADVDADQLVYWYRTHPASCGSLANTTGNNPAYQNKMDAVKMTYDAVFVTTLAKQAGTVTVTIGSSTETQNVNPGVTLLAFPFTGKSGDVSLSLNTGGKTYTGKGPQITTTCPKGLVNLNAFVCGTNNNSPGAMHR
jgi:hypothetical protein